MSSGEMSAICLEGAAKSYGPVRALADMTFTVGEGRFFVLFGPSSVGKTTTLRMIAGLTVPDRGSVKIFGRDVTYEPIAGRGVSMVFQSFALYPHLTVFDNLAYPLREEGVAASDIKKRVDETAAMLKLSHRLERKPGTLSGGEQQRVALGRSLIRRPRILLLDEPLTNLDAKLRHDMRAELKRLHRQFGLTIVYATPDELEALSMGEEIAVMRDGAVAQLGTPDELYENPADTYVAGKIGSPHMNMLPATIGKDRKSVDSALGRFATRSALPASVGGKALVGVRPSAIMLGGKGGIPSRIRLLEPLGDVTVVSVEAEGALLRVVLPEAQATHMKPGDAASVAVDAKQIHLFSADTGLAL
jgi:multiple sugar transport system ATP-binding protein